eukprot:8329617-Pyramimonas_sp.AAC.1
MQRSEAPAKFWAAVVQCVCVFAYLFCLLLRFSGAGGPQRAPGPSTNDSGGRVGPREIIQTYICHASNALERR